MLSVDVFKSQMERLQAAINYRFMDSVFPVWKKELEENGFADRHLVEGITRMIDALRQGSIRANDVHLGSLLRYCGQARSSLAPEETHKLEEARYRYLTQVQILSRGLTPFAKTLCANLHRYWASEITRKTWLLKHRDLIKKELGKYPAAVIDKMLKKCEEEEEREF